MFFQLFIVRSAVTQSVYSVTMALDIAGLVGLLVFYALILAMGIWASKKSRKEEKKCEGSRTEVTIIGGRNISVWIGVFTMTGEEI